MTAPSRTWALPQCLQFAGPWGLSVQRHLPGTACAGPGTTPARFYRLVWFGSDAWELFPAQSLGFKGFGSLHAWICSWGWRFGGAWPDRWKPQAPHVLWAASPAPPSHVPPAASSPSPGRVYLFEQRLGREALQRRVSPARLQDCSVQSPRGPGPGSMLLTGGAGRGGGLFFMLTVQLFSTPSFSLPVPCPPRQTPRAGSAVLTFPSWNM